MLIKNCLLSLALCFASRVGFAAPTPAQQAAFLSAPMCGSALALSDQYVVLGFGRYRSGTETPRQPVPSYVELRPTLTDEAPFRFVTNDNVVDLAFDGQTLWVLTSSGLEEWRLDSRQRVGIHETFALNREIAEHEHATGMEKSGENLVISHGLLGLSIFDLRSKKVIKQESFSGELFPGQAKAVDVALRDGLAFVLIDNLEIEVGQRPRPFRGLVIFDLQAGQIKKALPGIDVGARSLSIEGENLFIGFGQPIWKFSFAKVLAEKTKKLKQDSYIWQYGIKGQPIGKPLFDDDSMMTCFSKAPEEKRTPYRSIPMIFNRKDLRL